MRLRTVIKRMVPSFVLELKRRRDRRNQQLRNRSRSARAVFSEIYANNQWGGAAGAIFSGGGSRGPAADSYSDCVIDFIRRHGVSSVVDLGCGDFHIGSRIAPHVDVYTGVDVVPAVVSHHQSAHGSEKVRFVCLDAAEDVLPEGELCLIRQVLQHLSNAQIQRILSKLGQYKYVIITEHYPAPQLDFVANKDKPHGLDTRLRDNSAIVLDAAPFNVGPVDLLMSIPADEPTVAAGATIRSYLLRAQAS